MTLESHIWFRYGWYRAKDACVPFPKWIERMNRLIRTGNRANQMGLQYLRIENGGTEQPFLDRGLDI